MTTKVTRATLKSFIKKNREKLLVSEKSCFDPMEDGVRSCADKGFYPATSSYVAHDCTYGVAGVWVVGGGRDCITPFEKDGLKGFEVYNCCGSFAVAISIK